MGSFKLPLKELDDGLLTSCESNCFDECSSFVCDGGIWERFLLTWKVVGGIGNGYVED